MNVENFGNQIRVTVEQDDLNCERFCFVYIDSRYWFKYAYYYQMKRPGKRYKFGIEKFWSWYDKRRNTINTPPTPSQEVLDAVKSSFMSKITFNLETDK